MAKHIRFPDLATNLTSIREAQGLTISDLGSRANLAYATVKRIEDGRTGDPRASTVLRISKVLKVPARKVLGHYEIAYDVMSRR